MAKKIEGSVRHGGKVYTPGMEKELEAASGGQKLRGMGGGRVDSTEPSEATSKGASRVQELAARRRAAAAEARGEENPEAAAEEQGEEDEGGESDDEDESPARAQGQGAQRNAEAAAEAESLITVPVAELAAALEGVSDKKVLQSARRKDKRATAKPLYTARIESLQAETE